MNERLHWDRDGRDSFALYAVRFWLTDLLHDDTTSSRVRLRIWTALKRAGIPFARPARSLFMNEQSAYEEERSRRHRQERAAALTAVDLFRSLTDEEREGLQEHLVRVPYVAGERMTRQGAIAHWLYILVAGRAEIQVAVDGSQPHRVTALEAPDFFGEMGLMTGEPRLADVVAITDVVCFRLEKGAFESIVQRRPELALEFSQVLARRRVPCSPSATASTKRRAARRRPARRAAS